MKACVSLSVKTYHLFFFPSALNQISFAVCEDSVISGSSESGNIPVAWGKFITVTSSLYRNESGSETHGREDFPSSLSPRLTRLHGGTHLGGRPRVNLGRVRPWLERSDVA